MSTEAPKAPWHVWAVGIVALLWNVAGAVSLLLAQAGRLPNPDADEIAYYAAQPLWFVVVTDISLAAAVAAALGLLLRRRAAVWGYAISMGCIVITNGYELAAGTSRTLVNDTARIATLVIAGLAGLQLVYASAMTRRGILR
jgi:hypothetical protein